MTQAKLGDRVKVHYTGSLADGTVFDSSSDGDPLEFTIGEHEIIPGFETAVIGMQPGESKRARIAADQAYGPRRADMVETVERSRLPGQLEPEVGQRLVARQPDGGELLLTVAAVSASSVTLDANHPLAGEDLTFDIELLAVA
jgi:peptidylprolyl isomerase